MLSNLRGIQLQKKIIRGWGGVGVFAGGGGGGCWMMAWSNFVSFNKFRKFVFNSPLPQCVEL